MLIVEFGGPPFWSLDTRETEESKNYPWVGVVEGELQSPYFFLPLHLDAINPIASTQGHLVLSPVSFASRDQNGGLLNSAIDFEQSRL